MVFVPSNYVWWVQQASQGTGIPYAIVACQIKLVSGFNPNAVSPANAQGIAQFEPGTFAGYGHGSPFNVNDALGAYINFMSALLREFGGNLRNALAAYNAGPANIGAGMGYADTILSCAGGGTGVSAPVRVGVRTESVPDVPTVDNTGDDYTTAMRQTGGWYRDVGLRAWARGRFIDRI